MGAESFKGRTILVTGGAGFIGSHLVVELVTGGAEVSVLDHCADAPWPNLREHGDRYRRIVGDVRRVSDLEAALRMTQPEYVFHLAANASVPTSVDNPRLDFETNSLGTFNLLDAVRREAPQARVVFASSGAVYGEPGREKITELTELKPISPYGASKLGGEIECRLFAELFSIDVIIGRIFNSFGPRMPRFVVLDFLKKLERSPDELEILGSGEQTRDFTFVQDTVAGLLTLALSGQRGAAYNVASGESYSVTDLARVLLEARGLSGRTKLRYTGGSWAGDAQYWAVSIDKLRGLGYEPRFKLGDGLAEVVRWFEKRGAHR